MTNLININSDFISNSMTETVLQREDAEIQATILLEALRDIDREDSNQIRKVIPLFTEVPADKVRDYELRIFLENALLDYQTAADEAEEYEASAMALQFGCRLKLELYRSQALMLGIKDPLKTPIKDITAAIKNLNERPMVKLT